MSEAFVEHHRDVGTELRLDVRRLLGSEQMRGPIEVRLEARAGLVDRAARRETEHLIAAAVGQDRTIPTDEPMQAATTRDEIVARAQVQMIGIAQDDLGADRLEIAVRDAFDGALRADGHERRRLDGAVRGRQHAAPRGAVGVRHTETEGHVLSLVE